MATVKNIPEPPVLQPIANKDGKTEHSWQAWFFLLRAAVQQALSAASAAGFQVALLFRDEGVNLGTPGTANVFDVVGAGATLTRAGDTLTLTVPGAAAGQDAILFSDEGVPLGTSGTATSLDVVGAGAALSRVGNALTLTVPGSPGGTQTAILFQDEGVPLGTPGTVDTLNVVGTGATLARVGNTATLTVPGSAASQTPIQYQDEGGNLGTAGTADTVNFTGPGIIASRVGNNVTVNVPNAGAGTVTSVGLVANPASIFDVSNSPITTNGNITLSLDNQNANTVLAGPSAGAAATPAFRALTAADIPVLDGFRNKIIGGDFGTNPWQRGTNFPSMAHAGYSADRWQYFNSTTSVVTIQRGDSGSTNPTVAQAGRLVTNNLLIVVNVADAAIAAGDFCTIATTIEGYNFQLLAQRPMVLSFWHRHAVVGTYCVAFRNSGADRSFIGEYQQSVSGAWEYATIVISPSPVAGIWNYVNGNGIAIFFMLACGTNLQTAPNIWQTGNFLGTTNQVNGLNAVNNTYQFALVQLESGTVATPFEGRSFQEELELCQRYYSKSYNLSFAPGALTGAGMSGILVTNAAVAANRNNIAFPGRMRAVPTINLYSGESGLVNNWARSSNGADVPMVSALTGETQTMVQNNGAVTVTELIYGHWTADAEL